MSMLTFCDNECIVIQLFKRSSYSTRYTPAFSSVLFSITFPLRVQAGNIFEKLVHTFFKFIVVFVTLNFWWSLHLDGWCYSIQSFTKRTLLHLFKNWNCILVWIKNFGVPFKQKLFSFDIKSITVQFKFIVEQWYF